MNFAAVNLPLVIWGATDFPSFPCDADYESWLGDAFTSHIEYRCLHSSPLYMLSDCNNALFSFESLPVLPSIPLPFIPLAVTDSPSTPRYPRCL